MAESRATTEGPLMNKQAADDAYQLANKAILGQFQNKLAGEPTADLSAFLHQRAAAYDRLVSSLSQLNASKTDNEEQPKSVEPDSESRWLLLQESPEVVHSLDSRVLNVALGTAKGHDDEQSSTLSEETVAGLNIAIQEGEVLWKLHSTHVIALSSKEAVKISISLDMDEISNLQYLNSLSLGIPMPQHLGTLKSGLRTYFFMSRIPGLTLETLWPTLNTAHKTSVQQQLAKILSSLRSVPPPAVCEESCVARIGSFVSGTCRDMRRVARESQIPVRTEAAFNEFLCHHEHRTQTAWIKLIQSWMRSDHQIVPTHEDLHPRNIMAAWDGDEGTTIKVTGVIDWQVSGWYPEYWEYVKALSTISPRDPVADWCDYLPTSSIGSWPVEFSLDLLISRWLG